MRAYFFGNLYLSSIQQGIQSAHTVAEMFTKYLPSPTTEGGCCFESDYQSTVLSEWANEHKTMILLNAGYSEELRNLVGFFDSMANPYPWASFNEGQDALDGALTCVGIILPEQIYIGAKQLREGWVDPYQISTTGKVSWDTPEVREYEVTKWEFELMLKLNNYGLAR